MQSLGLGRPLVSGLPGRLMRQLQQSRRAGDVSPSPLPAFSHQKSGLAGNCQMPDDNALGYKRFSPNGGFSSRPRDGGFGDLV